MQTDWSDQFLPDPELPVFCSTRQPLPASLQSDPLQREQEGSSLQSAQKSVREEWRLKAGTQRVVVQIEHPELGAVSHGDGQSSPAFGTDSWVGTQRELPQTCTQTMEHMTAESPD